MLAAILAAVMSTCDSFMVHASALFTKNIYLPYIRPNASDKSLLRTGRIASILVVFSGVYFAFSFTSVVHGLMTVLKFTSYLGIAFWFGVIWKRANRYGALISAISMAATALYTEYVLGWPLQNQIALYLPIGILMMIIVSLFSKPEPEEQLRKFYTLLDTPVGKEQRLREQNIEIMLEGVSEGKRIKQHQKSFFEKYFSRGDVDDGLLIVDFLSLRKKFSWARYRTDILGFFGAILIVIFLILLTMFLANLGA